MQSPTRTRAGLLLLLVSACFAVLFVVTSSFQKQQQRLLDGDKSQPGNSILSGFKARWMGRPSSSQIAAAATATPKQQTPPLMPLQNVRKCRERDQIVFQISDIAAKDSNWVVDAPVNQQLYCELALLHSRQCGNSESASECIARVGASRFERVLPIRCCNSSYFQRFVEVEKNRTGRLGVLYSASASSPPADWIISAGVIPDSHRMPRPDATSSSSASPSPSLSFASRHPRRPIHQPGASYIPPSQRPFPNIHHKRRYSRINCSFAYRLPMSVPEEEIVESVTRDKLFDWNPVVPPQFGRQSSENQYSFGRHDEAVAAELVHRSYFAWTHRRGGWAAQRHLELLAAGTVPVFINIDSCPYDTERYCLPGFPVELLREASQMAGLRHMFLPDGWSHSPLRGVAYYFGNVVDYAATGKIVNPLRPGDIDWKKFNETDYFRIADELLRYTKRHLTTKAVAAYFLKIMGVEEPKGYVFITPRHFIWDGLGLMHGLAALGIKVLSPQASITRKMAWDANERDVAQRRQSLFLQGHRGAGFSYGLRSYYDNVWQCADDVWAKTTTAPLTLKRGEKDCAKLIEAGEVDLFAYSISVGGAEYTDLETPYYDRYLKPPASKIKPERVAFLESTDQAFGVESKTPLGDLCARGHKLFIRDVPDPPDADSPWVPLLE